MHVSVVNLLMAISVWFLLTINNFLFFVWLVFGFSLSYYLIFNFVMFIFVHFLVVFSQFFFCCCLWLVLFVAMGFLAVF